MTPDLEDELAAAVEALTKRVEALERRVELLGEDTDWDLPELDGDDD